MVCQYCGQGAHNKTTCQKRTEDLVAETLEDIADLESAKAAISKSIARSHTRLERLNARLADVKKAGRGAPTTTTENNKTSAPSKPSAASTD